jgi:RNA polymerase sigma factor (sigma-70 family)
LSRSKAKADAFVEFLRPLQRPLEVYCRRMLRDRSKVQDVIQNAVASAFAQYSRKVEVINFKAWIFRFVTLQIFNTNRQQEPVSLSEIPTDLSADESWDSVTEEATYTALLDDPEVVLEHFDDVVVEALERLAPLERAVILLRSVGEFSYKEIHVGAKGRFTLVTRRHRVGEKYC